MTRRHYLWALCGALTLAGCGGSGTDSRITISRGVAGAVYVWEGDFRPAPLGQSVLPSAFSRPRLGAARGLVYAARRRVELHPYSETLPRLDINGFVETPTTQPVATVISDDNGFFQTDAPPGRYWLLIREGERLWQGRPDLGIPYVPIEVREGEVATTRIDVTWGAVFR
jgi:hypothetical protein